MVPAVAFAALLASQEQPDVRVDVDLVTVACSVSDHGGAPVKNLKPEDFNLSDNGQPREIRNFWQESDLPLTVALVADVSGSQAGFVKSHRDAIAQFLKQVIGPRDRAMIVEVGQQSWLISDLTGSLEDLNAAVEKIGTREGKQSPMLGTSLQEHWLSTKLRGNRSVARAVSHGQRDEAPSGPQGNHSPLRWHGHRQRYQPDRSHRNGSIRGDGRLFDQVRQPGAFRIARRDARPGAQPRPGAPRSRNRGPDLS